MCSLTYLSKIILLIFSILKTVYLQKCFHRGCTSGDKFDFIPFHVNNFNKFSTELGKLSGLNLFPKV